MKVNDFIAALPPEHAAHKKRLRQKAAETKTLHEPVDHEGNDMWLAQELNLNLAQIHQLAHPNTRMHASA